MKLFHVVKHTHNDEFVSYSIYANNRQYLRPARPFVLGKREAYAICKLLNGPWPK